MDRYKNIARALMCGMADIVDAICDSSDRTSASATGLGADVERLSVEVLELNKTLSRLLELVSDGGGRPPRRRRNRVKADYTTVN